MSRSILVGSRALRRDGGQGFVSVVADTCDTEPMQLMSRTTGIVAGMPGSDGTFTIVLARDAYVGCTPR